MRSRPGLESLSRVEVLAGRERLSATVRDRAFQRGRRSPPVLRPGARYFEGPARAVRHQGPGLTPGRWICLLSRFPGFPRWTFRLRESERRRVIPLHFGQTEVQPDAEREHVRTAESARTHGVLDLPLGVHQSLRVEIVRASAFLFFRCVRLGKAHRRRIVALHLRQAEVEPQAEGEHVRLRLPGGIHGVTDSPFDEGERLGVEVDGSSEHPVSDSEIRMDRRQSVGVQMDEPGRYAETSTDLVVPERLEALRVEPDGDRVDQPGIL